MIASQRYFGQNVLLYISIVKHSSGSTNITKLRAHDTSHISLQCLSDTSPSPATPGCSVWPMLVQWCAQVKTSRFKATAVEISQGESACHEEKKYLELVWGDNFLSTAVKDNTTIGIRDHIWACHGVVLKWVHHYSVIFIRYRQVSSYQI